MPKYYIKAVPKLQFLEQAPLSIKFGNEGLLTMGFFLMPDAYYKTKPKQGSCLEAACLGIRMDPKKPYFFLGTPVPGPSISCMLA